MRDRSAWRLRELKALTNLLAGTREVVEERKCSNNLNRTEKGNKDKQLELADRVRVDVCVDVCVRVCVGARRGDKSRDMHTPVTLRVFYFLHSAGGPF